MTHGYTDQQIEQMMKNVAETGSTTRKYRIYAAMPVYAYVSGYIEVDATDQDEALAMAQNSLNNDNDSFNWGNVELGESEPYNTMIEEIEEINLLEMKGE